MMEEFPKLCDEPIEIEFNLDSNSTKQNIIEIIKKLDHRGQLKFFDHFEPQISDPGAYVDVYCNDNTYSYTQANHGWSSEEKEIDLVDLVDYIFKNREFNEGIITLQSRWKENIEVNTGETILVTPIYYDISDLKNN